MLKKFTLSIFLLLIVSTPFFAFAVNNTSTLDCNSLTGVCNPAGSESNWTVPMIASKIIKAILGVLGVIFVLLILWAGSMRLFAKGNATQIKKSYDTIMWAILGLVIIFSSYVILSFVFEKLDF